MSKVRDLHEKWSWDVDYRAACDELEPEFALARALTATRSSVGSCNLSKSLPSPGRGITVAPYRKGVDGSCFDPHLWKCRMTLRESDRRNCAASTSLALRPSIRLRTGSA